MPLPKWATTVTPLSKLLAVSIFVTFPFLSFAVGMQYHNLTYTPKTEYITIEKTVKIPQEDTERSLLKRCGEIPEKASPRKQRFDSVAGPFWSPNCRYVIWSQQASFRGYEGADPQEQAVVNDRDWIKVPDRAGIFFYEDKTEKILIVYAQKNIDDLFSINAWETSDSFSYTINGEQFIYHILTGKSSKK